jgi:hypothetical protein
VNCYVREALPIVTMYIDYLLAREVGMLIRVVMTGPLYGLNWDKLRSDDCKNSTQRNLNLQKIKSESNLNIIQNKWNIVIVYFRRLLGPI